MKNKMVNVFSFSIYGNDKKYTEGLLENIKIITDVYPEYEVWIYGGKDVDVEYINLYKSFKQVKYFSIELYGGELKFYRFFALDDKNVDLCFVRDSDSRITERDQWCISEFCKSNKNFHIIRDHSWHRQLINAGMWGSKKTNFTIKELFKNWKINKDLNKYHSDTQFLAECIYPLIKNNCLIHTNTIQFRGEEISYILPPHKDEADFIGNVMMFTENGKWKYEFNYKNVDVNNLYAWLISQNNFELVAYLKSLKYFD